jgi:HlyD family secretion protein
MSTIPAATTPARASRRPFPARGFVFILIAVVVLGALGWYVANSIRPRTTIQASGTIEATESSVASKVSGRLLDLHVRDGDRVRAGQVIATLEQRDPGLGVDQARANVVAASGQVTAAQAAYELERRTYETTLAQASSGVQIASARVGQADENLALESHTASLAIDQAQANERSAQAAYDRANIGFTRAKALVASGDEPQQMLDDATAALTEASARLQSAHDALALAQTQQHTVAIRQLDVRSSQLTRMQSRDALAAAHAQAQLVAQRAAQLEASRAALAQAQGTLGLASDQLHETQLRAPFDGTIISHTNEVGDLIQPGATVLVVGDLTHPYVNIYVSETDLPHIKTGMHADVRIDGIPNRTFDGIVTEIGQSAEYTPENVQTREERIQYLVFRVKLQFVDTSGTLKPGLPADATIRI